ncbi:class I SAM-dependent methyltransferase [Dysgonomonas sp. 511]|uniref:class I SAM-dependent methyltransferase n=1 Tax=Dysgonomonas sp. 511 TaxID=2302930 RepID=UPI0013D7F6B9|nr:class I SAM-dependent methyltransferase [Dysgonomonas sp. 511]NDV78618.1 class I SAM-dependent methyltransferase [Dysgonomonas sp. 511]
MPRIYKLSRTGLRILYKIRHHRGHGIHSPFVFNLITKVIEEKAPYHAYDDIKEVLQRNGDKNLKLTKANLLSFRLMNYFEAQNILEIGSGFGANTLCLTAHSADSICTCIETSEDKGRVAETLYSEWPRNIKLLKASELPFLDKKQDCIYVDLNHFRLFKSDLIRCLEYHSSEKTFIIVKGIRTNKRCQALWKEIINMDGRTAVLDLFNIGILFFDKKLYKWSYQISF